MTQPTVTTTGSTPANRGVKKGLPAEGLAVAEERASKLWAVARFGMTRNEVFAKQIGRQAASGSAWDTCIALMRGFKLIKTEGDQIGLTELGQQIVNTSNLDGQLEARRAAIMNLKAYNTLVGSYSGTQLPEKEVLASHLQFEYGKSEDFSKRAAHAFVESLYHARMVDEHGIVRVNGVESSTLIEEPVVEPEKIDEEDTDAAAIDQAFEAAETPSGEVENDSLSDESTASQGNNSVAISLTVNLDLSKYSADEVVQILQALGVNGVA